MKPIHRTHAPGVYIGLSAEDYHKDQSLSVSGIKAMRVSPLTYWTEFLSPKKEQTDTESTILGEAMHTIILEGEKVFMDRYARKLVPSDLPDHIKGGDALKEKCRELGLKLSGTIQEMSERIRYHDRTIPLFYFAEQDHLAQSAGKTILTDDQWSQCLRASHAISKNKSAVTALTENITEISVFFHWHGIPVKVRIDSLKPTTVVDAKSFANVKRLPVRRAVAHALVNYLYHVQAVVYLRAIEEAKELLLQGKVFGGEAWQVKQLMQMAVDGKPHTFTFVFIETGSAPNVIVKTLGKHTATGEDSLIWAAGERVVEEQMEEWARYMEMYGTENPWYLDDEAATPFEDEDVPAYAL